MFPDPESAYLQGMAYYNEQMEKWETQAVDETEEDEEAEDNVQTAWQAPRFGNEKNPYFL